MTIRTYTALEDAVLLHLYQHPRGAYRGSAPARVMDTLRNLTKRCDGNLVRRDFSYGFFYIAPEARDAVRTHLERLGCALEAAS